MRSVPMSSIDPEDPLVEELMHFPAYALDYARMHYRLALHGTPSLSVVNAILGRNYAVALQV